MSVPEVENLTLKQIVNYITKTYHVPLRKYLRTLDDLIPTLVAENGRDFPQLSHLTVLYTQFRNEILKHITREDFIVFPSILKYEKIYWDHLINLTDDFEVMEKLINDVKMQNDHREFNLYLQATIDLIEWAKIKEWKIKDLDEARKIFKQIFNDNITHSKIENEDLYLKWIQLQIQLQNKLKNLIK